jgi:hypothetical protein
VSRLLRCLLIQIMSRLTPRASFFLLCIVSGRLSSSSPLLPSPTLVSSRIPPTWFSTGSLRSPVSRLVCDFFDSSLILDTDLAMLTLFSVQSSVGSLSPSLTSDSERLGGYKATRLRVRSSPHPFFASRLLPIVNPASASIRAPLQSSLWCLRLLVLDYPHHPRPDRSVLYRSYVQRLPLLCL